MSRITSFLNFIASVSTQVRAAIQVGVPTDSCVSARHSDDHGHLYGLSTAAHSHYVRGRITRNGLGSFEIGAGKTRVDE